MAKRIFYKEYVKIDLIKDIYKFYNVEIKSVGHNEFHVIFHYGRLGTEGTKKFVESKDLSEANALAWKKIYEKKTEKFEIKEDLIDWLQVPPTERKNNNKTKPELETLKKQKLSEKKTVGNKNTKDSDIKHKKNADVSKLYICDLCEKSMPVETYNEINKWARGGGNWDKDSSFIGFKKVLCIDCQSIHHIWKKRM